MKVLKQYGLGCYAALVRANVHFPGKWRLRRHTLAALRRPSGPRGRKTVRTTDGFLMELDLSDYVDQHIYATGTYETMVREILKRTLQRDGFFIDIDANIGYFTLLGAQCEGKNGRVLAFEPVTSTRSRLVRNCDLNGCVNISVRRQAASDVTGDASINIGPREHSGISSLRPLETCGTTEEIETIRLDELLSVDDPPSIIKIDVEGAEMCVLRGLSALLGQWGESAPCLVLELSPAFLKVFGDNAADLVSQLQQLGYSCYRIEWDRIKLLANVDAHGNAQFNIVAFPGSPPATLSDLVDVNGASV
ncbi:hypothetical protein EC9_25310 [Rosistilla ulvae]|uniref:Methyltransferase FkbM domain-containing protein n=2 Tax=Rosistilla ulvae TaxID=1930277 RepID=A0A517M0E2_9BACT|nr:hypothetical protein EC9_25310 [Rosistilla ulvae]